MKDLKLDFFKGAEHSVWYQKNKIHACEKADYFMTSVKSPRHHVWSLFTECKYDGWAKQFNVPRSSETVQSDQDDFILWLDAFVPVGSGGEEEKAFGSKVAGPQRIDAIFTNSSVGIDEYMPNASLVFQTYKDLDFVLIARCLLYHQLGHNAPADAALYIKKACKCQGQNSSEVNNIRVTHHKLGHRSTLRDLPDNITSKISQLTTVDTKIYMLALKDFMSRIASLEFILGRRVMCGIILEKLEPELAYLGGDDNSFSVTELYNLEKKHKSNK